MLRQDREHPNEIQRQRGCSPSPASYRTIDELLREQAANDSDHPIVFYPSSGVNYTGYSTHQLDTFAFRAAKQYMPIVPPRKSSGEEPPVVALLGVSNLDYIITLLALTKLGHTVLFLSPRLTKPAYLQLLGETGTKHVVCQSSFRQKITGIPDITIQPIAQQAGYGLPINHREDTNLTPSFDMTVEAGKTAWIFHSSGSTGNPKPVRLTHRGALANYQRNLQKLGLRCFLTLPLFHTHGIGALFRAIITGQSIHIYNASLPLTKDYLIQCLESHEFKLFSAVPYALKLLSEAPRGIQLLKLLKLVTFGGSPCPGALGDMLVENGVNLVSIYGMSETGPLMMSTRPAGDKLWDYLHPTAETEPFLSFHAREQGLYELVCLDGLPSKAMSNCDDGSYATKDLFVKHPKLNAWKYCGRNDDVIVLGNGEKFNPVDVEGAVARHPLVSTAVVFGKGRPYPGMLVIPSLATSDLPRAGLMDQLWPMIEAAQVMTPDYAKISREMVILLAPGVTYPKTDKDTVIRKAFYNQFSREIDEFYSVASVGAGPLIEAELLDLIRTEAQDILGLSPVPEDSDFFALGMNSLQASRLRNFLVKKVNIRGQQLGLNVVFDHPSVRALASYLHSARQGQHLGMEPYNEKFQCLLKKYGQFEQHRRRPMKFGNGQYVVLTGATGSLGAHLLATLVRSVNVRKVCCLVRARGDPEAKNRVMRSLHTRKIHQDLSFAARHKIVCVASDLSIPSLGLQAEMFEQIASEMTVLYHCAWTVNFNLHLSSFERDCIAGVKHLIDLCLLAHGDIPATFSFFSSIATVLRTQDKSVPESLPTHLSNAQPTGYGQSKLVAEHVCMNAAAQVGIPVYVLRIGQAVGDTIHGVWNSSEAIPLAMQSAMTTRALPSVDEDLRWIPVDLVARTAVEITTSGAAAGVFNVVNPHTFHWTRDLLRYLQQVGLEFDVLDPLSWLGRFQEFDDPVTNPPIRLFEYFKRQWDTNTPRRVVEFEIAKTQRWSKTFSEVQAPDRALVEKMVRHLSLTAWSPSPQYSQLRPIIAFSSSMTIPFGCFDFDTVDVVAALVSMRLGVPVLDSASIGFGTSDNGIGPLCTEEALGEQTSLGVVRASAVNQHPAFCILEPKNIRKLPLCRVRFLILRASGEPRPSSMPTTADQDLDAIYLDTTGNARGMVEEAEFWVRDFLQQ